MTTSGLRENIRGVESKTSWTLSRLLRTTMVRLAILSLALAVGLTSAGHAKAVDKAHSRAERALKDGDFETAEKLFRELLAADSLDDSARLGLSYTLLKERHVKDAYDHAARVVARDPLSARAHSLLGSALLAGGDFRLSVEEFRTALSLKSEDPLAVAGLAMVDFYDGRLNAALDGLRRAVSLDGTEPDFVFDLGQAASRTDHYKEAADAYEKFLAISPRTDEDRRNRIRGLIDFLRYLSQQNALYSVGGASRTVVPITLPDSRPIIEVRLNGRKEAFRFVLDTGSGISVISQETANRMGMKAIARGGMARAVGGAGRFEIVYGFLESMEVGDVKVSNVPVYIRKFYGEAHPVDGYIGLSLINKFLTTVDYGLRTFELDRNSDAPYSAIPGNFTTNGAPGKTPPIMEFPFRLTSSGFLSSDVQLVGIDTPLNFIVDTGASISVLSSTLAKRDDVNGHGRVGVLSVYGAAGVTDNVEMFVLPKIVLGPAERKAVRVAVLDLDPVNETSGFVQSGIVGGNFLRHYRITFDFNRNVVQLVRIDAIDDDREDTKPAKMDKL